MKNFINIIILASVLFTSSLVMAKHEPNIYNYPRPAPEKYIYSEAGNMVKLSDFEGDFVIAVFWSRFCTPCIKELKSLNNFAKKNRKNNIRVIMVSLKNEWKQGFAEQKKFLRNFGGDDLEMYVDDKNDLAAALGIFSSPVNILINSKGEEIGRIRGSIDWDDDDVIEYFYKIKS